MDSEQDTTVDKSFEDNGTCSGSDTENNEHDTSHETSTQEPTSGIQGTSDRDQEQPTGFHETSQSDNRKKFVSEGD